VCSRRVGSSFSITKNGAELPTILEHTSSPPFFLVEKELPILLEHTSSPPFFLEEQELPILLEHTSSPHRQFLLH
jgi:hypothetical protein